MSNLQTPSVSQESSASSYPAFSITSRQVTDPQSADSTSSIVGPFTSHMERWLARREFYELHYLQLLNAIVDDKYTELGKVYDDIFWRDFTNVYNNRIMVADGVIDKKQFNLFTVLDMVDAGVLIKQKFEGYMDSDEDYPNKKLIENCYNKCLLCTSLPKYPAASGNNLSSYQNKAIKLLVELYNSDQDRNSMITVQELLSGSEYLKATINSFLFLELKDRDSRLKFVKELHLHK